MNENAIRTKIIAPLERVLENRGLECPRRYFRVTNVENGHEWLFCVFDHLNLRYPIAHYARHLHEIRTAVGAPVVISNSTGLRYAVLLGGRQALPAQVEYPGFIPSGLGLGETSRGPLMLADQGHILIGGSTGSGKSNLLKLLAVQAIEHGYQVYLADPEENTFNPQLWDFRAAMPVAVEREDWLDLISRLQAVIRHREDLFQRVRLDGLIPEDLVAYNRQATEPLPPLMVVADEANSLLESAPDSLGDLLRRGRKWGLRFVLAGHAWQARQLPTALRSLFAIRMALHYPETGPGRVILESQRLAKKLLTFPPGRGIYRQAGESQVFQAYWMDENYHTNSKAAVRRVFSPPVTVLIGRARRRPDQGKIDVNWVKDTLQISYAKAHRLCREMELHGLIEKRPALANARYLTTQLLNQM